MHSKPRSLRFILWMAVSVFLLKAAVPLLASLSAQAQGKSVVEVCDVYGVATIAKSDAGHSHGPTHKTSHKSDHCALTGLLLAQGASDAQVLIRSPAACVRSSGLVRYSILEGDACHAWMAQLGHGPPALA